MTMENATIPPTTPPTIAPPELVIFGEVGPGVSGLGDEVPVELELSRGRTWTRLLRQQSLQDSTDKSECEKGGKSIISGSALKTRKMNGSKYHYNIK
jgi:hypothetical protein